MDAVDECYAGKDLSILNKLTLIIPTYNRNFYLSRCLWYHAHFPFAEIIVADSSPEDKKRINRITFEKIHEQFGVNMRYIEFEPETERYGGDIYEKWGEGVQNVETEYSQICTDKEFLIPTTLCECLYFLDEHPDYTLAEGMDYRIESDDDNLIFCPWQGRFSAISSDPVERVNSYILDETIPGLQFSIQRTCIAKKVYLNLYKYKLLDLRFGETAIEIEPVILGKTKKFADIAGNCRDCLYEQKKRKESSTNRYPPLLAYPPEYYNELSSNLASCINDLVDEVNSCNDRNFKDSVGDIVERLMEKRYIHNPLFRKYRRLYLIWYNLPSGFKQALSRFFRRCTGTSSLESVDSISPEMRCICSIISSMDEYHDSDTSICETIK
ncbi:TIGR00180 family glycosyltransferase [Methanolacinia paynteri]|uniref:TIGR00180 family glycosyltransferase n=1 Tax=Methanolacinia paynteri TaxID=230356 RepID=UPI00064FB0C3|nr:TIGR00180 family glycosyltransferase [Methanolacinia paynteri]